MPSFFIDLRSGKKQMESGYLNGAISRFGGAAHVSTPANDLLDQKIEAMVLNNSLFSVYDHQPEKLLTEILAKS
jgi:ketopantoate reductase